MIDVVIPLGKSKTNFLDLKYALRALDKFTKHGTVYIIGEKPNWITGVEHIAAADNPDKRWKERNIYLKAYTAFKRTNRYLMMNDDHFLLRPTDIENYPYYFKGTCYQSMLKNASHYRQTMNQTKKFLEKNGYEDKNFDGHCPIIFEEDRFFDNVLYPVSWVGTEFGFGMKSLYCAGMEGVYMDDKKLSTQVTLEQAKQACEGRSVISCTDAALCTGLGLYLAELFPEKSKYERD